MNRIIFILILFLSCVKEVEETKKVPEVKEIARISEAKKFYSFGREDMKNKMYESAIRNFQLAIKESTDYVDAYINLGLCYETIGDYGSMEKTYKELVNIVPVKGHYALGWLYTQREEYNNAIREYEEALKADSTYSEAFYGIGYAYEKLGNDTFAINYYKKTIEIDPANDGAKFNLAKAYIRIGNYEEGINLLKKLKELHKEDLDVKRELGKAFLEIKKYSEAKDEFKEICDKSPNDVESKINLGRAYEGSNENELAIQAYNEAIGIDSTNFASYYYLINLYIKLKRLVNAKSLVNIASKYQKESQIIHCLLGDIYYAEGEILFEQKKYNESINALEKAKSEYESGANGADVGWRDYAIKSIERTKNKIKIVKEEKWWH